MASKLLNKVKEFQGNIGIIIALITSLAFIYNSYIKDNPLSTIIKNQKVYGEAIAAEYDMDKVVFKRYHLCLYHSNKNSDGRIKYSYLKYKGRCYKAWIDPTSGYWQYLDGRKVSFIKELSH